MIRSVLGAAFWMVVSFVLLLALAAAAGLVVGAVAGGAIALLTVMVGNDGGAAFVRVAPWLGGGVFLVVWIVSMSAWFHSLEDELAKRRRDRATREMEEG